MKLFRDNTTLTWMAPLRDAQGRPIYDAEGRPIYGNSDTAKKLRYDTGAVGFRGVTDAEKTCEYTRSDGVVTENSTTFANNAASYGQVETDSILRIESEDDLVAYTAAKTRANQWMDELMGKATGNMIDILQWITGGKFALYPPTPSAIYQGDFGTSILANARNAHSWLSISEEARATVSTTSSGDISRCSISANVRDIRRAHAMLWCFPTCAPGCKLKITIKSYAKFRCYYMKGARFGQVFPTLSQRSYTITAYPVNAAWTNQLNAAIPLDRYNPQNIAIPFPSNLVNGSSTNTTSWESEITIRVPASRILVAVIDPTQFLPWVNSAIRSYAGYETSTSSSNTFVRERNIDITISTEETTPPACNARPMA